MRTAFSSVRPKIKTWGVIAVTQVSDRAGPTEAKTRETSELANAPTDDQNSMSASRDHPRSLFTSDVRRLL
jgi:hypothetical protein